MTIGMVIADAATAYAEAIAWVVFGTDRQTSRAGVLESPEQKIFGDVLVFCSDSFWRKTTLEEPIILAVSPHVDDV